MADFGGSGHALSMHRDVMEADPSDESSKAALVDELKSRGNAAFKAKRLPEAEALYSRALDHAPTMHTLYGNRSMVRLSLGKVDEALIDANKAVEIDESWGKGYFRQAQALTKLERFNAAARAFERASELAPSDKKLLAQLEKARKLADEHGPDPVPGTKKVSKPASASTTKTKIVTKTTGSGSKSHVVRDTDGGDGSDMRGYKTLADGRKTTFFNHTQTAEEKELIGDIAPKKVEPAKMVAESKGAGSSWNFAGTFEEKSRTPWVKQRLEKIVGEVCVEVTDGDGDLCVLEVEKLEDVEGDASIACIKGKIRHILSFQFKARWSIDIDPVGQVQGTIHVPDFNIDDVDDIEVEKSSFSCSDTGVRKRIVTGLDELIALMRSKLAAFVAEFKEQV